MVLKSTLSSSPVYMMSLYIMPMAVVHELEKNSGAISLGNERGREEISLSSMGCGLLAQD